MRIEHSALFLPKRGNTAAEYEDAFSYQLHGAEVARCAIADGATESSFAKVWAELLVNAYSQDANLAPQWQDLQARWFASAHNSAQPLPWYAEAKLAHGGFAAFLGLEITPEKWQACALGDCCLFHLRNNELQQAFPLQTSQEFNQSPFLMSSQDTWKNVAKHLACLENTWETGDEFFLLSDALACWCLQQHEQNNPELWQQLRDLNPDTFPEFIAELREQQQLRNDDVTLVRLRVHAVTS